MKSFFKNLMGKKPTDANWKDEIREESVLQETEAEQASLSEQQGTKADEPTDMIGTPVSLHESWERLLDTNQKYSLSFVASDLPPIAKGNISLAGFHIAPHEDGIEVNAFLRNGSSRPVKLGKMTLLVLFGDNQLFTRQEFDLSELGEIPAYHARPWTFVFDRTNFLQNNVLLTDWKVAFEVAQKKMVLPQQLELEESWIKALTEQQKNSLIELAKNLPPLGVGEVNIQSVQATKDEAGSLRAILLFRNGSEQSLSFEKLPLVLFDAQDEPVAQGMFELGNFTVNTGTSKPWMFIFPPESIVKQEPDLSRWKVALMQS